MDLCEICGERPKISPREQTCGRDECLDVLYPPAKEELQQRERERLERQLYGDNIDET